MIYPGIKPFLRVDERSTLFLSPIGFFFLNRVISTVFFPEPSGGAAALFFEASPFFPFPNGPRPLSWGGHFLKEGMRVELYEVFLLFPLFSEWGYHPDTPLFPPLSS